MTRRELKTGRRIVLLCEGKTEILAVQQFLRRQWTVDSLANTALVPIDLRGHLENVSKQVPRHLNDPKVLAVFTLIDLCRFGRLEFSGAEEKPQKVALCAEWLRDRVPVSCHTRFFPHLSVHEVESWILAEGKALAARLGDSRIKPASNAEDINDQETPKARLHEIFKRNGKREGYLETRDGYALFGNMDFQPVYDTCLYFRAFYDDLKRVAANWSSPS